jgi:hypothetical protein
MIGDLPADIDWGFSTETGLGFFFVTLTGSSFLGVSSSLQIQTRDLPQFSSFSTFQLLPIYVF